MNENDDQKPDDENAPRPMTAEERAKQLSMVVCICKGIKLSTVLPALEGCETVQDVNRKAGTGSGGCGGERCGPRIKALLRKMAEKKAAKK